VKKINSAFGSGMLCPRNTDTLTATYFSLIFISAQTPFLRSLGFTHIRGAWNNAHAASSSTHVHNPLSVTSCFHIFM